jgi:peptidoglycan/LPS O-acetylase OafA/YrhL
MVYIYHMVVVNFMLFVGFSGSVQYLAICLIATLLLSLISWKIIERSSLRSKLKSIRSVEKDL